MDVGPFSSRIHGVNLKVGNETCQETLAILTMESLDTSNFI